MFDLLFGETQHLNMAIDTAVAADSQRRMDVRSQAQNI